MTLEPGKGSFVWDDTTGQSNPDKPLEVFYYRPDEITADTPVWIIMHGASRNADDYRDYFVDAAKEQGALVIAPEFNDNDWDGSTGYNLGNISASNSDLTPVPEQDWSFSKIEPLFDYVVNEVEPTLETDGYYMYGHSAGAQFTHRFLAWEPDARVKLAVAANAGWYTVPQSDNVGYEYNWPYSTSEAPDYDASTNAYDPFPVENLENYFSDPLVVLLGQEDTRRTSNLRQTEEADAQGRNRFERGQFFYAQGQDEAQTLGVDFNWELQTVPGVGHEGDEMAIPAAELFRLDYLEEYQSAKINFVWEDQGLTDDAAVATGSSFNFSDGSTVTINWNTQTDGGSFVPKGGDDFVSYDDGLRGNHQGYLNLGFNNSENDPDDLIGLSFNFDQPVAGLKFDVLDVDEGSSFDDGVEIYLDGVNILDIPDAYTLGGSSVKLDNETYMTGFEGRSSANKSSTSGNIQVNLGSREVSQVDILYFSTDDTILDPKGQSIGISDLNWDASNT
ncbi:MAG: hypothetical protein QNJ70_16890 [Xenococcaceae cyanobacterium MO_207.B15]|nr:hypothetical protein [Xenococcaceae cyanobacterium MO_207.B15]